MKAAIAGTGLIGASIGLALRSEKWEVIGWDPQAEATATALAIGALDDVAPSLAEAMEDVDLVVLAGPPAAIVATLPQLHTDVLVIDVSGVKHEVMAAGRHLARFVGTHPMAGREHPGPEAASAALFKGAAWIVVGDGAGKDDVAAVDDLVRTMGARPVHMSAEAHDSAVAVVSHLPQIIASTLVAEAADNPHALVLAAGSFRDLTRVALSDPALWSDLLVANRRDIVEVVRSFSGRLAEWADTLSAGNTGTVETSLIAAQRVRRGLAPPVVAVGVVLEDRPGELAAVGRALADSRVDVRDLQLRHGRLGGGGVLVLSVRPGEAEALRQALHGEGFVLDE
ncbi:MAG: prephenate dehydrogenase/arogenate dehydrogenase family protein [Acidimicrobiia bacterium]|nr:prephenate dehydrogenase/arogenate dehydrogenase family protein [Acidimicrobiia bacterium]